MSLQVCMHPRTNAATMKIYPCVVHEITRKAAAMFRPMTRSRPRLLKQPSHRINKKSAFRFITALAWKFIHSFIHSEQTDDEIKALAVWVLTETTFTKSSSERVSSILLTDILMSLSVSPDTLPLLKIKKGNKLCLSYDIYQNNQVLEIHLLFCKRGSKMFF